MVGVVGRNGPAKTTLLRMIAGIFGPTEGRLEVGGHVASLLELGAGFHPDFTGRENVYMNGAIHGLKRKYVTEKFDEIVAFRGVERFIDVPVRTYSAGMYMRPALRSLPTSTPDVLLLDEVFAVGDESFQRKCINKDPRISEGARSDAPVRLPLGARRGASLRAGDAPQRWQDPLADGVARGRDLPLYQPHARRGGEPGRAQRRPARMG